MARVPASLFAKKISLKSNNNWKITVYFETSSMSGVTLSAQLSSLRLRDKRTAPAVEMKRRKLRIPK